MADETKKTAAEGVTRRSQRGGTGQTEARKVTTEADVQEAIAPLRQARIEAERQKEIEAQKRTTSNPADAKNVDPEEAAAFAAAERSSTGSDPLPQRRIPTDNSLPNSDDQYVVPHEEEIEEIVEATDAHTSDLALAAARKRSQQQAKAQDEARPKTQKFIVQNGSIFTEGGKARVGDTVELTAAEAKSFNRMGRLAPYIED